jgi:hypothetical protein
MAKHCNQVILYDIGSGSTEAALVKYSVYGKPGSSKGATNQFEVLDVEWDHRCVSFICLVVDRLWLNELGLFGLTIEV